MKNAPKAHPCRNVAHPKWKRGASLRKLGGLGVPLCKRGTPLRKLVAPLYNVAHRYINFCTSVYTWCTWGQNVAQPNVNVVHHYVNLRHPLTNVARPVVNLRWAPREGKFRLEIKYLGYLGSHLLFDWQVRLVYVALMSEFRAAVDSNLGWFCDYFLLQLIEKSTASIYQAQRTWHGVFPTSGS